MTKIYVAFGGGSPGFNGIYEGDENDTTFLRTDAVASIFLRNITSTWDLDHNSGDQVTLYRLSTSVNSSLPVSTNGASPAIQTYEFVNGNAQIGIEITNASSAVNGTYTWSNSIVVGGGVGTVSGYYKGSGADLIVIYWATNMWKIVNSAGTVLYNGDFQSTSTTPPVSNYSGTEEYWTGVGGLTEAPSSRVSVVGGGGASAPVMKILMKTVQVVIIANDPQVNGIYYLVANPDDRYNSFFSKDGGDSYPRIIYNNSYGNYN